MLQTHKFFSGFSLLCTQRKGWKDKLPNVDCTDLWVIKSKGGFSFLIFPSIFLKSCGRMTVEMRGGYGTLRSARLQ